VAEWVFEPLDRSHERADFSCGKTPLDDYLRTRANQYEKRHLGRTYVAVRPGKKKVFGYYTLASSAVPFTHLPSSIAKKLPKHPVPAVLLARLAVDQSAQGQGLGSFLLGDALGRAVDLSKKLGIHIVEVDAIDSDAKAFYEQFAFVALRDEPLHLILPVATIENALKGP
jgi:GNAT superfamily N-acetyltransferase